MSYRKYGFGIALALIGTYVFLIARSSSQEEEKPVSLKNDSVETSALNKPKALQVFDTVIADSSKVSLSRPQPDIKSEWKEMARKFDTAPSLRAFFYEAIKNPKQGGYFYAMAALGGCRGVENVSAANATSQKTRAANEINTRCDFSEQETHEAFQQLAAVRGVNVNDDPLLRQLFDFTKAKTDAERMSAMASIIDMNNPQVIRSAIAPTIEKSFSSSSESGADSSDLAAYSLDLVECNLGANCGGHSDRALELCAKKGWCADSVQGALRIGLGENFDKVSAESSKALNNISTRNFAALVKRT